MPNIIMADKPSGGQQLVKLLSGTYTATSDGTITVPVAWTGTPKYMLCEAETPIADTAQTVTWQVVWDVPMGVYSKASTYIVARAMMESNTLVNVPVYKDNVTTDNGIMFYSTSSLYPVKANTYKWEIWGYAT